MNLTIGADGFSVDADALATGRTCVIGASGSGKSYAVGVICEELAKASVPFAIVDTEGEYSGLKAKYDVIWVADDEKADERWGAFDPKQLAEQAPNTAPLILDVSECMDPRGNIGAFLTSLYRTIDNKRTPYLVIVEEADKFIPQDGKALAILDEIARRGRKRGLGLVVCTQRPSLVAKNVLSQCNNQLIGKLNIRNDLQAVAQFFPKRELPKQLTSLEPGRFYVSGTISPEPQLIQIRARETMPGGGAPKLKPRTIEALHLTVGLPDTSAVLVITLSDSANLSKLVKHGTIALDRAEIQSIHIAPGNSVELRSKGQSVIIPA